MKKILLIIVFFQSILIFSQESNIGLRIGAAYYVGELNLRTPFKNPAPAITATYRHNFNEVTAFRIDLGYNQVRGDDSKSEYEYEQARNYKFQSTIWSGGLIFEFNLNDFDKTRYYFQYFTPYIATGIYGSYEPHSKAAIFMSIPIEVGFKYAATRKILIGAHWTYRWTSTDYIDNLSPDKLYTGAKQMSYNPNMDWLSYAQVFISFNIKPKAHFCPAY